MKFKISFIVVMITCVQINSFADDVIESVSSFTVSSPIANEINNRINTPNIKITCTTNLPCASKQLKQLYKSRNYEPIWLNADGTIKPSAAKVIDIFKHSYSDGLNPYDYHSKEIQQILRTIETKISTNEAVTVLDTDFDLTMSDAYLLYSNDLQNGRIDPAKFYPTWGVDRTTTNVLPQFEYAISTNTLVENLQKRIPTNPQYLKLKDKLSGYNELAISGDIGALTVDNKNVKAIKQIALNMDRLRWLPNNLGTRYIWVNIPDYQLKAYTDSNPILTMPVVVGKGGQNKTCAVSSNITTIEANPYWGIPHRIATKEYLSKIQKNPNYLESSGIRVYRGNEEVDPTTIDWNNVTEDNFNYFLRQDPGRRNALGKYKFIFSNSCGIYLHDTSNKGAFGKDSRNISHGCVRVGRPSDLANYLMYSNSDSSTTKLNDAIKDKKHIYVKLQRSTPVYIVYQTAVVESNNKLRFVKDIYGVDQINFPVFIPKGASQE